MCIQPNGLESVILDLLQTIGFDVNCANSQVMLMIVILAPVVMLTLGLKTSVTLKR